MPTDTFVRLALPRDVEAIAAIQAKTWRASYTDVLPDEALESLPEVAYVQWEAALAAPPTDAHHVLVAIEFEPRAEEVVGFAAVSPSDDADADPRTVGSLIALIVDADHRGAGHGARLLAAAVDTMRANRFSMATTWQSEADTSTIAFLTATGWALDGARREIDTGRATIAERRLHTALT